MLNKLAAGALFLSIVFIITQSPPLHAQKAGKGLYEPWTLDLDGASADLTPIIPRDHYIRVEVPKWFINNRGNFLSSKIVSGTVEIGIGDESYNGILGTFPLSGDNKVAPVFNRAIIDNRVYNGGDLTFKVFIKGIKRDTAMGGLLKSLADTALNVAVGQVSTMTGLGAVPALNDASKTLTDGVKESLNKGESSYAIFEEGGGLQLTFNKQRLSSFGRETFWLAYRGDSLVGKQVKIVPDAQGSFDVKTGDSFLREGAWVLFRITRESAYGNARPWMLKAEQARKDLTRLMQDWQVGAKTHSQIKEELAATLKGDQVADRILALRSIIESDSALSSTEQAFETGRLIALLRLAQNASNEADGYSKYFTDLNDLQNALTAGTIPTSPIARSVFANEVGLIATSASAVTDSESLEFLLRSTGESATFAFSTTKDSTDTSLLAAEDRVTSKSKQTLAAFLEERARSISNVSTMSEPQLWKRFGEIEYERIRKSKESSEP